MKQNQCQLVVGAESWQKHSIYQHLPLQNIIKQIIMLIIAIILPRVNISYQTSQMMGDSSGDFSGNDTDKLD
jgi:hypothetical protein